MSKLFGNPRVALGVCLILAALYGALSGDISIGSAAPFHPPVPAAFAAFDGSPAAVMALDKEHPGIAETLTSKADGSVRDWFENKQGGKFRLFDKSQSPELDEPWVKDAFAAWKAKGGSVPWIVAASPNGKGINQALPESPADAMRLVKPLGVK